jgi:hypothetical protein
MIAVSRKRLAPRARTPPVFSVSPMETLCLANKAQADCAVAFFTALGYLVSASSLASFFVHLRANLREGGYFFCDVWQARQAIKSFSPRRVKTVLVDGFEVERLSLVTEQAERNALAVEFVFTLKDPENGKICASFNEHHVVRYFSPAELTNIAMAYGFEVLECRPFMEEGSLAECWNFSLFAKKRS